MAVETVDPADCGSYILHAAHRYRSGWWKKSFCRGSVQTREINLPADWVPPSAALVPPKQESIPFPDDVDVVDKDRVLIPLEITEHKHCLRLVEGVQLTDEQFLRKPDDDILWECDWLDCKELFVMKRAVWQEHGVPYNVYD